MMVHKDRGRSYVLDLLFDGVGRIHRASGTADVETFKGIKAMLRGFYDTGDLQYLRAIKDGTLSPLVLYALYREGRLSRVPMGPLIQPLQETWMSWATEKECSPEHRRALLLTLTHLQVGSRPVIDLPELFKAYLKRKAGKLTTQHRAKAHVLAFLKHLVGSKHEMYEAMSGIPLKKVVVQDKASPLSVSQVREGMRRMPHAVAEVVWTMCATGMHTKELWGVWRVLTDRVEIEGTKREGRNRTVPYWTPVVRPSISQMTLKRWVRKAWQGTVRPHDFRATFIRWAEEAGIRDSHVEAYAGHKAKTITKQYSRGDLPGVLEADAQLLRAYVGEPEMRLVVG